MDTCLLSACAEVRGLEGGERSAGAEEKRPESRGGEQPRRGLHTLNRLLTGATLHVSAAASGVGTATGCSMPEDHMTHGSAPGTRSRHALRVPSGHCRMTPSTWRATMASVCFSAGRAERRARAQSRDAVVLVALSPP